MDAGYKNPDGDRAPWTSGDAFATGGASHQGMVYAIQHPFTGEMVYPPTNAHWRYGQEQLLEIMNGWCPYVLRDIDDAEQRALVCGLSAQEVRKGVRAIVLAQPLERSRFLAQQVMDRGQWPVYYVTKGGNGGFRRKTYLDSVGGRLPTNFWSYDETGHTDEAAKQVRAIFDGQATFDTPKPTRLVEHVLKVAGGPNSLVLDSFAGSGTTGEAVLSLNRKDGGDRHFILVELGDYAETTTAERTRRVIGGYTVKKSAKTHLFEHKVTTASFKKADSLLKQAQQVADEAKDRYDKVAGPAFKDGFLRVIGSTAAAETVPGTGGSFSYYELGPQLLVDGNLNPAVEIEKVREYIWFTETAETYRPDAAQVHPDFLGRSASDISYFFAFNAEAPTVLDLEYLASIPEECAAESYVIYADICLLSEQEMRTYNVIFKKIPRDITRL